MYDKHEFDAYAKNYRKNLDKSLWLSGESSTFFAEYKAQKIQEWFPDLVQKKISILDFGCGDGLMTSFVQHIFVHADMYGVDPSTESIEIAREAYEGIHFSPSDETLHFPDNSFDFIYAAGVFHHIPFDQHEHYKKELLRVLKPNGTLLLFELNPLNPLTVYTFKTNPIDQNAQMMTPWYTKKLLQSEGNTILRFYCFFPKALHVLRFLEPYLTWLPFSALYAVSMRKSNN